MKNPFIIREINPEEPFCDRTAELKELVVRGASFTNLVLYSHRRYGKTSLVTRVQNELRKQGMITVYANFFGVVTIDEVAERVVKCLYAYCHRNESLFEKAMRAIRNWRPVIKPSVETGVEITVEQTTREAGLPLLEETFSLFGLFAKDYENGFNIVLDEFQEIANLPNAVKIEGVLRTQIQTQTNVGYVFVGSLRRMLLDIFNEQRRPFYKSAINYPLGPLPKAEAVEFIIDRFRHGEKDCPVYIAEAIYDSAEGCPYYVQRIPHEIFVQSDGGTIKEEDRRAALTAIVKTDTPDYECILQGLSTVQKQVLYAIAKEPVATALNLKYMARHRLASTGSTQPAFKKLISLDLIEKRDDGKHHVVDPFLAKYLAGEP